MLPERREEQRPVILYPVVRSTVHELRDGPLARVERVCDFEMLVREPLLVVPPLWRRAVGRLLCGHAEEEVDGGLLIVVCPRIGT